MTQTKILGFIPAYNCQNQLPRVLTQIDQPWVREIFSGFIIVENQSTDKTLEIAISEANKRSDFLRVFRNDSNYGLGGSHKVALNVAKSTGVDWLLVFHGDDQGNLSDFKRIIESGEFKKFDAVLGARFTKKSKRFGYSSLRTFGNYIFNSFYSVFLKKKISDMGSGLNMYSVKCMEKAIQNSPDGLIHPPYLLISFVLNKFRIHFEPIGWKETDQVSNAKLFKQSFDTFKLGFFAFLMGKKFLKINFENFQHDYSSRQVSD